MVEGRKISLYRLIGLLGVIALIVGVIALGGGWQAFVHVPCILLIFGIAFFLLLGIYGRDFLKFIPDAILTMVSRPKEANERYAEIALTGARCMIGAGVIGTLIGVIQLLNNLENPKKIGVGMAVTLLSMFYAVVVSEVFLVYLFKAYSNSNEEKTDGVIPLKNVGMAVSMMLVVSFLIMTLLYSFSTTGGLI